LPSLKTIGYQEFKPYLKESPLPIEQIQREILLHTKQYAKRQITWFKRNSQAISINDMNQVTELTKNFLNTF
jgi:tRNA dimethylallyltransferase